MRIKSEYLILAILFIIIFSVRLYFAFQSDNYLLDAYYTIRQVDHILDTGLPVFKDNLSYGGRTLFQGFLYFYVLAFFRLFLPEFVVYKIIPNLLVTSIIIIIYYLSLYLTQNKNTSLFSAYVSGFIPVFYLRTINDISVYSLVTPIILLFIYCMLRLYESRKYVFIIIILILFLRVIHPSVLLLIFSLLIYLIMIKFEGLPQLKEEIEIILFSTFLILWSIFITFKKPFLTHGIFVIWQNIPSEILINYFKDISIIESIYSIGLIPLIFGVYTIYKYLFKEKNRKLYLIISFSISISISLWLKLISLVIGMLFLSPILVILFSVYYKEFLQYLSKTRFQKKQYLFVLFFTMIFLIFSVIPSLYSADKALQGTVTNSEIKALEWISRNTEDKAIILGNLYEGHLINTIGKRGNVIDTNFLLIDNIDQRFQDINIFYRTPLETEAIRIIDKYGIGYIYFSQRTKELYNIQLLSFVSNKECFKEIYNKDDIQLYKSLCTLGI